MNFSIATLTMNPVIDVSTEIENVVPERKLRCSSPVREPGGGGINVSRVIRELGGDSLALYPAGGPPGDMLKGLLTDAGLHHRCIPINGWTRETVNIFEKATQQQFRFIMPGPELREEEWHNCLQAVKEVEAQFFVISGSMPPGVPADFFVRLIRSFGRDVRVIVDTSGNSLRVAAEEGAFLLKPNLRELGELAGEQLESDKQAEHAAMKLIGSSKCEAIVVSLGRAGVLLASRDGCRRLRAPDVRIQSKVGAGDSMVGGIVLALSRGRPLEEAVRLGTAAGSAAVMTSGSQLCRRHDVEQLYEQIQFEKPPVHLSNLFRA